MRRDAINLRTGDLIFIQTTGQSSFPCLNKPVLFLFLEVKNGCHMIYTSLGNCVVIKSDNIKLLACFSET